MENGEFTQHEEKKEGNEKHLTVTSVTRSEKKGIKLIRGSTAQLATSSTSRYRDPELGIDQASNQNLDTGLSPDQHPSSFKQESTKTSVVHDLEQDSSDSANDEIYVEKPEKPRNYTPEDIENILLEYGNTDTEEGSTGNSDFVEWQKFQDDDDPFNDNTEEYLE